ncbi:MAG: hypothetical protein AAF928_15710 [Myxococcota bacterium]
MAEDVDDISVVAFGGARWPLAAAVCAVLVGMSPSRAWAEDPPLTEDTHLTVEGGTHFPLDVGGQVAAEVPYRLRFVASLGVLPGPYVDTINEVVVSAGGYDEPTADLIAAALDRSLVARLSVGWRPLPRWGWTVDAGYGLVTLGGEVTGADLIGLAVGVDVDTMGNDDAGFDVMSTLHLITFDTGYEWVFFDRLVLGARIGFAGTLDAVTEVVAPPSSRPGVDAALQGLARESEAYLDDIYETYVFTPVASLTVGYRFF